jgi:hypothetical protein
MEMLLAEPKNFLNNKKCRDKDMQWMSSIGTLFKLIKPVNFPRRTNVSSHLLSDMF